MVVLVGAAIEVNDLTGSLVFISTVVAIAIPEPRGRGTVILTVDDFTGFAGNLSRLSAVALVVVELGTISDAQGDSYSIEFEVGTNSFITFNETMMTLSIAPETKPGTYVCKIFLTDDNLTDPQTSNYEFVITINEAV